MKSEFNVLIIGAGNIGALYDHPSMNEILTHAHAFTKVDGFSLAGFVDKDFARAKKAADIWGCEAFSSMDKAFENTEIDVACVAVPDEYHFDVLKNLSDMPLRLVFAEKPLAKSLEQADELIRLYKRGSIKVAVNYTRRYVPEFIKLKNDICSGIYGSFLSGTGYYGKGILHNGSHMIDILRFLLGEATDFKSFGGINDFYEDDPSVSAVLDFGANRMVFLQHVDCNAYEIFDIDLFFEKKRIRILDCGLTIEEYDVIDSQLYKGYRNLHKSAQYGTKLNNHMEFAALNIYEHLIGRGSLKCNIQDAYRAMEISLALKGAV